MGALTSKPYTFTARPWELKQHYTFDFFDTLASKIRLDYRGEDFLRVLPLYDAITDEEFINDRIRFFYDILNRRRVTKLFYKEGILKSTFIELSWQKFFFLLLRDYLNSLLSVKSMFSIFPNRYQDLISADILYKFSHRNLAKAVTKKSFLNFVDFSSSYFLDLAFLNKKSDIFLVGVNLRVILPLLNFKLRKGVLAGNLRVFALLTALFDTYHVFSLGMSMKSAFDFFLGRSFYFRYFFKSTGRVSMVFLDLQLASWYSFLLSKFDKVSVLFKSIGDVVFLQNAGASKSSLWQGHDFFPFFRDIAGTSLFIGSSSVFIGSHPFSKIQEYTYILPSFTLWEQRGFFVNSLGVFFDNSDLLLTTGKTVVRKEVDFFYAISIFFELFLRRANLAEVRTFYSLPVRTIQISRDLLTSVSKNILLCRNYFRVAGENNLFKLDNLTMSSRFLALAIVRFRGLTIYI